MAFELSDLRRALALCLLTYAGRAGAQASDTAQIKCDGRVITAIDIEPHPPAMIGREPSGLRLAIQHFVFQSATTRGWAIRPFVLARPGQRCYTVSTSTQGTLV